MPRVYQMYPNARSEGEEPRATLIFGDDGICLWASDETPFATFFPGQIYTLPLDDISGVLPRWEFVPVPEDDPAYADAQHDAAGPLDPTGWAAGTLGTRHDEPSPTRQPSSPAASCHPR